MIRMLAVQLHRDRIVLPLWILGGGLLAYAAAAGVQAEFGSEAERRGILQLALATPSLLALRGLPDGSSLGSYLYFQVFCYLAILAALMSTFLVVRHSRADEERGRREMLAATPVARSAPLIATLLLALGANAVLGGAVAAGLAGAGLPIEGALVTGLAASATGLAFAGVAACVGQLTPTSRAANGMAAATVGVAFMLRSAGDALGTPDVATVTVVSAWPSWLSPIGWGQQVFAFTRADLAPLLLSVLLFLVTAASAIVIQARRDLGASLIAERAGRPTGRIRSAIGLAWRRQRTATFGWAAGSVLLGALSGSLATALTGTDAPAGLDQLLAAFVPGGASGLTDLLISAFLSVIGFLAAAAGVQAAILARGEESDGRVELVLAAPVGRRAWLFGYVAVAAASVLAVAMAGAVAAAVSFLPTDGTRFGDILLGGLAQLPAGLTYVALVALVLVVAPRLTVVVGWLALAAGLAIGQFGGLIGWPQWVRDASPFTHTPAVPIADADWTGAIAAVAVAVALTVAVAVMASRRQVTA